jgi:hypothetical protein
MGTLNNMNYIKNIFRHPCGTPTIETLIETAIPAASVAILSVVLFGCDDIMKMRLGRAPWHTRSMKGLINAKGLGVRLGLNHHLMLDPFTPIFAALQWMLYADAATGFVANWMSLIYQAQDCRLPGNGYLRFGLTSLMLDPGGPYPLLIDGAGTRPCVLIGGNEIQIPPGCEATITWNAEFKPFRDDPANLGTATTWLEDDTGLHHSESDGWAAPEFGGRRNGGGTRIKAPAAGFGRNVRLKWRLNKGLMGCRGGNVSVSAYGRPMKMLPAGCTPRLYDQPYPTAPVPPPVPGDGYPAWLAKINKALAPPP